MNQAPVQHDQRLPGDNPHPSNGCPADKQSRRLHREKLSRVDVDKVARTRKED